MKGLVYNVCLSLNIFSVVRSVGSGSSVVGELRNACGMLVRTPTCTRPPEKRRHRWENSIINYGRRM